MTINCNIYSQGMHIYTSMILKSYRLTAMVSEPNLLRDLTGEGLRINTY